MRQKSNILLLFLRNIKVIRKKTWEIIKDAIGKTKIKGSDFPRKLSINNKELLDVDVIANNFNDYFVNIGSNLAAVIPSREKHFSDYLTQTDKLLIEKDLTLTEFETAFLTLKEK